MGSIFDEGVQKQLSMKMPGRDSPSSTTAPSATINPVQSNRTVTMTAGGQQLTIFYRGQVCVCQVSEDQAKDILRLLKQESVNSAGASSPEEKQTPVDYHYHQALCMKRSLQRFLHGRKMRAMEASPYHRNQ